MPKSATTSIATVCRPGRSLRITAPHACAVKVAVTASYPLPGGTGTVVWRENELEPSPDEPDGLAVVDRDVELLDGLVSSDGARELLFLGFADAFLYVEACGAEVDEQPRALRGGARRGPIVSEVRRDHVTREGDAASAEGILGGKRSHRPALCQQLAAGQTAAAGRRNDRATAVLVPVVGRGGGCCA